RQRTSRHPRGRPPRASPDGSIHGRACPAPARRQRYRDRLPEYEREVDSGRSWCNRGGRTGNLSRSEPVTSTTPAAPSTPPTIEGGALTIETIEVTPIVVPLAQEYRGSYYRMNNRSTVLTRVVTREGI